MYSHKKEEPDLRLGPLAQTLMRRAEELTRRVTAQTYVNPFWDDRYGARGRLFIEQDGKYHIEYLCQALQMGTSGEPEVLIKYALWLRTVLVSRGMCSRHLSENFEHLAAALSTEAIDGVELAVAYLHKAAAALRHPDGPAQQLEERESEVLQRAVRALAEAHPEWASPSPPWESFQAWCSDELRYCLSYLADALSLARPELLARYLTWSSSFVESCSVSKFGPGSAQAPQPLAVLAALQSEVAALGLASLDEAVAPIFAMAHASLHPRSPSAS